LFVRLIVHLSKSNSFWAPKKEKLIESFASLLARETKHQFNAPTEADIKAKLEDAWKKTASTTQAGDDPGSFLRAWLFAAADTGVPIPDAYFGVAKMLHTIDSQCRDMGLKDVITEEVTRLFKTQLTFKKTMNILLGRSSV
jgi:hypothetical protein